MDWTRQLDGYCERLGPGFWAEPLNAVTNAAFLLAAVAALVLARRAGRLDGAVAWLIALLVMIGVGSFLFHTLATAWAALADTGPITVFILSYFAIAMTRFGGLRRRWAALLTLGFLCAMAALPPALAALARGALHGSGGYIPALLALLGVGLWLRGRGHPTGVWLMGASGLFAISLAARTLDMPLCSAWPVGTHFLWHVLNALLLCLLVVAVIRHGRLPGRPASHT